MLDEPDFIGDWLRERVLGSGAFGVVTLWRNSRTNYKIAIKKCKVDVENNLTAKHKERWTKEVEMMQRIDNHNIVSFEKLPSDFERELHKYNPSKLPMLSMEFCTEGDLRGLLSRAENCCGLPESDVRYILFDLMNAVSYLHSLKITHRDLKPENVVLQTYNRPNKIIYKLIDLGYAKEIDANSIQASFVGTLQYLAPEFFYSKTYSCSVDYWSLGLVAFEVICGIRPFLSNMSPAQWMNRVQEKKSEHICIYQREKEIIYSKEIFSENHVSSCFKQEIEKWLQISLEFDPKKRGHVYHDAKRIDNELVIFTNLENLLKKKIISVFSVCTYKFFSYEIDDFTLVTTLQGWIERDTKILKTEQILMCGDKKVNTEALAVDYFDETYYQNPMLYVFKKNEILKEEIFPEAPDLVKRMLETSSVMPYHFQKLSYAHALYFVFKENKLYNTLLDACNLKIKYMLKLFSELRESCGTMMKNIEILIAQKDFSRKIMDCDVEQYLKSFSQNASHWVNSFVIVAKEIDKLQEVANRLFVRYESAYRRIGQINNNSEKEYSKYSKHILVEMLDEAFRVYSKVKNRSKDKRIKQESCLSMVKVVYEVLKQRDKLLNDKAFAQYQQKILAIEVELEKMFSPVNIALQHIEKTNSDLLNDHISRQKKIWEFTIKPKVKNNDSVQLKENNVKDDLKCKAKVNEEIKPNFIIGYQENVDHGTPLSLDKPLNFMLGDIENIKNEKIQSQEKDNSREVDRQESLSTVTHNLDLNFESNSNKKHILRDYINDVRLSDLQIGVPASLIIDDNHTLRYELQEKTNQSFLKCKSILSENLDFSFLAEN